MPTIACNAPLLLHVWLVVLLHGKVGNMPSADGVSLRNKSLVCVTYIAA